MNKMARQIIGMNGAQRLAILLELTKYNLERNPLTREDLQKLLNAHPYLPKEGKYHRLSYRLDGGKDTDP